VCCLCVCSQLVMQHLNQVAAVSLCMHIVVFAWYQFANHLIYCSKPSVLWCCCLGGRKGIRPVKKLTGGVLVWLSLWNDVQICIWPSWCHCHSLSLALVKSRLVLPFWYRLTRVVPDKGPLNGCVCFWHHKHIRTITNKWQVLNSCISLAWWT